MAFEGYNLGRKILTKKKKTEIIFKNLTFTTT